MSTIESWRIIAPTITKLLEDFNTKRITFVKPYFLCLLPQFQFLQSTSNFDFILLNIDSLLNAIESHEIANIHIYIDQLK